MKRILCSVWNIILLLLLSAARSDAFSMSWKFQKNNQVNRSVTEVYRRVLNQPKRLYMTDSNSVNGEKVVSVDKQLGEEEPIEYNSQTVTSKLEVNVIFFAGIITVLALVLFNQVATFDSGIIRDLEERAMQIPIDVWNSYSTVLTSSPVQTKAVTSATVYTIGDVIAQRTEGVPEGELDRQRIGRSLLAGLLGHGPLSHLWYNVSENLFQNVLHLPNDAFGTAAKVVIDQTTWGPFWNNTYILMLGLMKLDTIDTILAEMKRTTIPLIVSGLKLWPLAHCVTYGLVPVENRLLWVDFVEIAWVTILATTAAGSNGQAKKAI